MKRFILFIFIFNLTVFSQGDKEVAKSEKKVEKREYSEKEFLDAVMKEVEHRLQKIKTKNISTLIKEVLEKEDKIKLRELNVEKQKEVIVNNQKELNRKIIEFESKQKKILGCIDDHNKDAAKRVSNMVDVLQGMRPANAAQVLSVQDSDLAVKLLAGMSPEKVSKIFNVMEKEISARLQKQYLNMKQ